MLVLARKVGCRSWRYASLFTITLFLRHDLLECWVYCCPVVVLDVRIDSTFELILWSVTFGK